MDTLSLQAALCGLVYALAYLVTRLLSLGSDTAWGAMFVITVVVGMVVRRIMERTGTDFLISPGVQKHLAGICVDYAVAASVAAISLPALRAYALPLFLLSLAGGVVTVLAFLWLPSRVWRNYRFERTLVTYGTLTGTMDSGIALCRVVDPELRTPAVEDYVRGMPLMFLLILPPLRPPLPSPQGLRLGAGPASLLPHPRLPLPFPPPLPAVEEDGPLALSEVGYLLPEQLHHPPPEPDQPHAQLVPGSGEPHP